MSNQFGFGLKDRYVIKGFLKILRTKLKNQQCNSTSILITNQKFHWTILRANINFIEINKSFAISKIRWV